MNKIGLVLSKPPGYSETFFISKIKGLQRHGFEVTLFCQNDDKNFNNCPVYKQSKIVRSPWVQFILFLLTFVKLVPYYKQLIRYIRLERAQNTPAIQLLKNIYLNAYLLKAKVDWLHFGFATLAIGSELIAKAIGAKMAVSLRGFDISVYPLNHPGCYKTLWKEVDKVHVISDDLLIAAKKQGLPNLVSIQKIVPAIDLSLFEFQGLSDRKGELIFLTIGRLHWKKGFVDTLMALSKIKEKKIPFTYFIIGEGSDYERIAFAVNELQLSDQVRFLGRLPHIEVRPHLLKADIYLQYSIQEGFCNAVLEAQAMGKLCIVSDAEGLAENVLHKQTGWVVPKGEPLLLANQIMEVIDLPIKQQQLTKQAAVNHVKNQFSIEQQVEAYVQFYNN